jgi:hypothetical protein
MEYVKIYEVICCSNCPCSIYKSEWNGRLFCTNNKLEGYREIPEKKKGFYEFPDWCPLAGMPRQEPRHAN